MAEMDVTELKQENVQALVELGMLKAVRETKVKFVLCADSGLGKLHIKKNGATCWCGRQWSKSVSEECPEVDTCRKCLRSLASSWAGRMWCWTLETTRQPKLMLTAVGQIVHGAPRGCEVDVSPTEGQVAHVVPKRACGWGVPNSGAVVRRGWMLGCPRLLRYGSHGKGLLGDWWGCPPPFSTQTSPLRGNPW